MGSIALRSLAVLVALPLFACSRSQEAIQAEFDAFVAESNRFEEASECVIAAAGCPLGCFVVQIRSPTECIRTERAISR